MAPASATDWRFVGRDRELDQLRKQLDRAIAGHGSLALLLGEPGIGKTRIAEELDSLAVTRGARVLWARSWEGEGAPAYWPWAQVLRSLLDDDDPGARALAEAGAPDLTQILPELAGTSANSASPASLDSAESRFRLFAAVSKLLTGTASIKPLVVVFDDLHWADHPSLLLLHFLARGLRAAPLFALGTYRDVEIGPGHPLVDVLGKLARESTRIPLTGLSPSAVRQVLAEAGGTEPDAALVAAVHEQTEGNPFFVTEVVRLLQARNMLGAADGVRLWDLPVPQGAREMITGHLGRLSERCRKLLSTAAVVGREFDTSLLERLGSISADELLDILQEAAEANVIAEAGPAPGHFCFTHALFRETIYGDLGRGSRVSLHGAVGVALEAHGSSDRPRQLAALAHHFFQADPKSAKALNYTLGAGHDAEARLAYEEAVRYFERAILILDSRSGGDQVQRCELLLALGEARSKTADINGARSAFKAAADTALQLSAHDLLARSALGYGGRFPGMVSGVVDRVLVELLEQSLALLGEDQTPLRATLLARLSRALFYGTAQDRRLALSDQALSMARAAGDGRSQVAALNARFWVLTGPEQIHERLATATEMATLAMRVGDIEMALQGHQWRLSVLAELGDMVAVDIEIDEYSKLADQLRQPLYSWFAVQFRVMRALMSGRFSEAERRAGEALVAGERIVTSAPVTDMFTLQLLQLRSEQGAWKQADEMLERLRSDDKALSRSFAALYRCRFGHMSEARAEIGPLIRHDLSTLPRDTVWLGSVAMLAEVCTILGDRRADDALYPLLAPYAEHNVMIGGALQCKGSASHFLGLLAGLGGRLDEAVAHFDRALAMNAGMGAAPLVARTEYEYARVLATQGGSRAAARQLLADAVETAGELGMNALAEQCRQLGERISGSAGSRPERPLGVTSDNCFKQIGDVWEVRFGGTDIRAKDTKGMRYLAALLRRQGSEIHVADLVGASGIDVGHAGDVLDSQAKAEYQARIRDLNMDLADAETSHDVGRIDLISGELDFISQELAAAYGLSGRSRRSADASERMRKAVTNRIRATAASLAEHNPRLGQHLSNSIRTGYFCGYFPEEPMSWEL